MTSTAREPAAREGAAEAAAPQVLIADDDPDILFLLARLLQREGYAVVTASDGLEALRLARETEPDLLVLDVSMPGADGYEVCRQIQADGSSAPPVIFLTAHANTSARVSGLDAGAVDYITKPFNPEELRARVRAALRTKSVKDTLAAEAATDGLTGLLNRSQLGSQVSQLVALARRNNRPLACLMIDLDHFKAVNDTYGHAAGDAVLAETARRFSRVARESDVLIRYGGEEFLALLPETDASGAVAVAEKFRAALAAEPVAFAPRGDPPIEIGVRASIGVAFWRESMADAALLVAAADEALYRAKSLGRDRIESVDAA